jgi:hypothetical protein
MVLTERDVDEVLEALDEVLAILGSP